jgi:TetR/AcrR family transcriptional regulator
MRPSKPTSRNPEATRKKLLEAAYDEFGLHGLSGGKIERVARRAKVNKRLVYHYFKDREGLYSAVLEHAYSLIHRNDDEIKLDMSDPVRALEVLIDRTFERVLALPKVSALIADENQHKAKHIRNAPWMRALHSRLMHQIRAMLKAGNKTGVFRTQVDPVHLFMSILGLSLIYFTNMHTMSVVFSRDLTTRRERTLWKKHIFRLCLDGIRS